MSDYMSYAELKDLIITLARHDKNGPFEDLIDGAVCNLTDSDLALMAGEVPKVLRMPVTRGECLVSIPDMLESNFRDLLEEEVEEALCLKNSPSCASPRSRSTASKPTKRTAAARARTAKATNSTTTTSTTTTG